MWLFCFKYEKCPNFVIVWKKKLKLFLLKNLIYLEFKWFKCCKVKKVTLQEIICCYKIAFILAKLANSISYSWLLFWLFFGKNRLYTVTPTEFFNETSQVTKILSSVECSRGNQHQHQCTLAKILSIESGELLKYWVISFISSKMLPTNLIQLDNPPEIKFCAFYKVCHKKFKKILNIKKVSPNSRLDWDLFRQCLALAQLESV